MTELEAGVATMGALLDLPEPLLLLILAFLDDPRSRHRASMACCRMLAAEQATRAPMELRGDPRTAEFLLLPTPGICFLALERLDLWLASPWGNPLLSSTSRVAGAPSSSTLQSPTRTIFMFPEFDRRDHQMTGNERWLDKWLLPLSWI